MTNTFTIDDAGSICVMPFLVREQRAEAVRAAEDAREAARYRGVSWSGAGPAPRSPRTPEQVRTDAEAAAERAAAFAASPRGRFLLALRELQDLGWDREAERARAAASRGFIDDSRPANPQEVGFALACIEPIQHSAARTACLALAELLIQHKAAA